MSVPIETIVLTIPRIDAKQALVHAGGSRMLVMTGAKAKNYGYALGLEFPLGKMRRIFIELSSDLYTITGYPSSRSKVPAVTLKGIGCEELKSTLERVTGLAFSL